MGHSNKDIAQECAADFLKDIWGFVDECHEKNGWNEMYIVKVSKRDKVRRIIRTHLSAFEAKPGIADKLSETIGVVGSFCLYVRRTPKMIKHVWNLPFEKKDALIIPDGFASSLILDSVSRLKKGMTCHNPEMYAALGNDM
jgi:hypothetical protein